MQVRNAATFIKSLLGIARPRMTTQTQDVFDLIVEKERESRQKIVKTECPKLLRKILKRNLLPRKY
jgi:hypothetical protein